MNLCFSSIFIVNVYRFNNHVGIWDNIDHLFSRIRFFSIERLMLLSPLLFSELSNVLQLMIYKKFMLQLSVESIFLIPIQLNSPWNWRPTVIEFVGTMRKVLVSWNITSIWFALDNHSWETYKSRQVVSFFLSLVS